MICEIILRKKLKIWENEVVSYFPAKSWVFDIGCGLEAKFFAYADTDCYWKSFTIDEIIDLAQKTGFTVMECKRGIVYKEEDGPILHCL